MIWLRVKMNRTRMCTAAHFERNEIKYQKSRESGLFQHILYACSITCLSFIGHLYRSINRSFTNVTRCPLQYVEIEGEGKITVASICDKKEIL